MDRRLVNKILDQFSEFKGVRLHGSEGLGKLLGFYGITAKTGNTTDLMSIVDYATDLDDVYIQKIDTVANKINILVDCRTNSEKSENNLEIAEILSGDCS